MSANQRRQRDSNSQVCYHQPFSRRIPHPAGLSPIVNCAYNAASHSCYSQSNPIRSFSLGNCIRVERNPFAPAVSYPIGIEPPYVPPVGFEPTIYFHVARRRACLLINQIGVTLSPCFWFTSLGNRSSSRLYYFISCNKPNCYHTLFANYFWCKPTVQRGRLTPLVD